MTSDRISKVEWSKGNPNDDFYEYVELGDCDGTVTGYRRRRPRVVIEAGPWEITDEESYRATHWPEDDA